MQLDRCFHVRIHVKSIVFSMYWSSHQTIRIKKNIKSLKREQIWNYKNKKLPISEFERKENSFMPRSKEGIISVINFHFKIENSQRRENWLIESLKKCKFIIFLFSFKKVIIFHFLFENFEGEILCSRKKLLNWFKL